MTQVADSAREARHEWVPAAPARPAAPVTTTSTEWGVDEFGLPDYDRAPDTVLFDRLARRTDIVALGALYTRHAARLYGFLQRVGLSGRDAEPVLCEIFVDLWRHHTAIERGSAPDGSVDAVAVRTTTRHRPHARTGADFSEPKLRCALHDGNGQSKSDPPSHVRTVLMTRLGHPAVDHEIRRIRRSSRPAVLLFTFAVVSLTALTICLLLVK